VVLNNCANLIDFITLAHIKDQLNHINADSDTKAVKNIFSASRKNSMRIMKNKVVVRVGHSWHEFQFIFDLTKF